MRIHDHRPFKEASLYGSVLPLYIFEPGLWQQLDRSRRQYDFLIECLNELNAELSMLGQPLVVRTGDACEVLESCRQQFHIDGLWSHEETGNYWSYQRDLTIRSWAHACSIPWHEYPQHGVIRGLKSRDGWSKQWQKFMSKPQTTAPVLLPSVPVVSEQYPDAKALNLSNSECPYRQRGGRKQALAFLASFFDQRCYHYTKGMSSPTTAWQSCSRLSPHLAFGTLSMREIYQASCQRQQRLDNMPRSKTRGWRSGLNSLQARLHWHCHFMQKLEDEPSLEFYNLHPSYDGLREPYFDQTKFQAWCRGETGFPMIDACMRALHASGWINFRMRAMLMSFASYQLWLHWREPSLYLAQLFTDYEPGIHYSQCQMQSGTTGINATRIYSPTKQGLDHDPDGSFIRFWIPELAQLSSDVIHKPWYSSIANRNYPSPVVDEKQARKEAARKIHDLRKTEHHRQMAQKIQKRHGSRR